MQLYGTPLSHFSRKIRILLQELDIQFEFFDIGNVAKNTPNVFCGNPLMKVPILKDNGKIIFDSDNIARYIVNKYNSEDYFRVYCNDPEYTNTLAVTSGIMGAEVKIILAQRTGMQDIYQYSVFSKAQNVIINGLRWLNEQNSVLNTENFSYLDISVVCMWDHLQHYKLFELDFPFLENHSQILNLRPKFASSKPS